MASPVEAVDALAKAQDDVKHLRRVNAEILAALETILSIEDDFPSPGEEAKRIARAAIAKAHGHA